MAFGSGHSKGPSKGSSNRATPINRGSSMSRPTPNKSGFGRPSGGAGFGGPSGGPGFGGPSFGSGFGPAPSRPMNSGKSGGNGLFGALASAAVGVAGAAIVNKMQENSQMKLQEQQAETQMKIAEMQAERQAERAEQNEEYQLEMQRLKNQQEEIKLEAIQPTKRYHANCPYCLGVNTNGSKVCDFCGSSLAYYDEADNK